MLTHSFSSYLLSTNIDCQYPVNTVREFPPVMKSGNKKSLFYTFWITHFLSHQYLTLTSPSKSLVSVFYPEKNDKCYFL